MEKSISKMFLLFFVLLAMSTHAFGQFGGGDGSEATPYQLSTAIHLKALADDVNGGQNYAGKYFVVTADINLLDYQSGQGWTPIANTSSRFFHGSFNGRGHIIKGLVINRAGISYQGFFGNVGSSATIDSLYIENATIVGGNYTGGLAGANAGVISNCHYTGTVTGGGYTGGLVGYNAYGVANYVNAVITKCYASATVTASGSEGFGGVVGYSSNGLVSKCWFAGEVNGTGNATGGIVGFNFGAAKIENCYNTGKIVGSGGFVGGIVGMGNNGPMVYYSYSTNTIQGGGNVGGIAGQNANATTKYCVAINDAITGSPANRVVGNQAGPPTNLSDNYALKTILVNGATVSITNTGDKHGADKTEAELQTAAPYTTLGWDFTDTWALPAGGGFPILKGVTPVSTTTCNSPKNAAATTPHIPNWYAVNLTWNLPELDEMPNSTEIYNNGPLVTHTGAGYNGADASAVAEGSELIGFIANKDLRRSLADDFILTKVSILDSVWFYTIQTATSEPSPSANIKELFIRIYDGAPNAGGQVVWGDFTTNRLKSVSFANIYRAPESDLTNQTYPIMRVVADLGVTLSPGTYWIEMAVTSVVPVTSGGIVISPPITVEGQISTGNAMFYNQPHWYPCSDSQTGGIAGLPFHIFGKEENIQYNIYRDNNKLTATPISSLKYTDIAPGAGDYTYGISAVYDNSCESEKTPVVVHLDQSPCETGLVVTSFYNEGFEAGFPTCWSEERDENNKPWEMVLGDVSEPATANMGMYKALFSGTNGVVAKLITRRLDISGLEDPELSFWFAQKEWSGAQDQLKIYYKNSESGQWNLLASYTDNVPSWTHISMALPAPTANYWIAFEATGNGGYGLMLDEVSIRKAGSVGCDAPTNLETVLHTPKYYNVNLSWTAPENSVPAENIQIYDNGTIITHPGIGYNGADVSAIQTGHSPGGNGDGMNGYSLCDDFTLTKPTLIDHVVFYTYDLAATGTTPNISHLYVRIFDKSPREGGIVIWGDEQTDRLDNDATVFSNIYRTPINALDQPVRPVMRTVAKLDVALPAGTYWIEALATSKSSPAAMGNTWFPPITILGESNTGNAVQYNGLHKRWDEWIDPATGGSCGLPFELYGKEHPLTYDITRDGAIIGTNVAPTAYEDITPGEGTYEYGVVAVWENGCKSDTLKTVVVMPADPCETAISTFPYNEGFETVTAQSIPPSCWTQDFVEKERIWNFVSGSIGVPNTTHSGSKMAYFYASGGAITKLITPMFDISGLENPTLSFWHTQRKWGGDQNELRIYYKKSAEAEWIKIAEYTEDIYDWTKEIITLPEKSATYWIAFEGTGNLGRAIQIDDITVENLEVFTITASVVANGSISPNGSVNVSKGDTQVFTITPNSGYKIAKVLVDGVNDANAVNSGSYTFTNVTANHTISAEFEQITYTITATAGTNGSITPASTTTVSYGSYQAYTITADAGYKIKSVLVDGTAETAAVGASSYSYTFSNVTANHTISAEFEQSIFTITASAGANGSIAPSGTTTISYGNNQTYTITADAGYKIKSVLVDGTAETAAVGASSYSYTFSNVTANHTISAEFEQNIFTITATADANGTIAPDGATTLTYGDSQEYTITANEGYKIKSVLVDDVAETAAVGASSYSYTFSNVTANHTISAEFEQITYTITATAGANGTIAPSGITTVSYGSNQAYTITANNDYLIKEVKVDGVAESAAVGKTTYNYTFSNVKANHTISATFEIANPELTGITVNNQPQTISSAMDYMAACGEQSVSMTLTAVGEVKVNGAAYTNGSPISLTGDKTVITITVTAGSNIATYTLTVAKALGSTTPLYIERWGATLAIVNNPANNGGYTFDQIRWYRDGSSAVVSTDAYVVGNISTHYADVHAVETGAWHHTCRTKATPAPVQIVVYPNPVLSVQTLNVNLPEGLNEVNIDVYDINGKLVKQHPRVTTTLTAPTGTGIYVLKIQLPDGSITTEKIVVK